MRTNELRKAVIEDLEQVKAEYGIKEIYYKEADEHKVYPHLVINFRPVDTSDFFRSDYIVDVDVYSKDEFLTLDISDAVEEVFCNNNDPRETILPTFFLQTKQPVDDPDKSIHHVVVRMQSQLYKNE